MQNDRVLLVTPLVACRLMFMGKFDPKEMVVYSKAKLPLLHPMRKEPVEWKQLVDKVFEAILEETLAMHKRGFYPPPISRPLVLDAIRNSQCAKRIQRAFRCWCATKANICSAAAIAASRHAGRAPAPQANICSAAAIAASRRAGRAPAPQANICSAAAIAASRRAAHREETQRASAEESFHIMCAIRASLGEAHALSALSTSTTQQFSH